ncbi:ATP-binding protein [Streptomyces goshikiensis]
MRRRAVRGPVPQVHIVRGPPACRMLRLPTIRSQFPELAKTAGREQMSYLGFLSELLLACLIGDFGTGKSHLVIALGTEAAMAGHTVKYVLAAKLVNELVEAADEKQLTKTIARYGRVDLPCMDELRYMELDRRGAELLFQVLTQQEEENSAAIASNEPSSGWTKTLASTRARARQQSAAS